MLDEMPDHRFQLTFHDREQVGAWIQKVFEVRRRKDQHLAGPIARDRNRRRRRAWSMSIQLLKSASSCFGLLREEVVGETHRHLSAAVQLVRRPHSRRDSSESRRPHRSHS